MNPPFQQAAGFAEGFWCFPAPQRCWVEEQNPTIVAQGKDEHPLLGSASCPGHHPSPSPAVCLSQPDVPKMWGKCPQTSLPASPDPHMDRSKLTMLWWGGSSPIPWTEGRAGGITCEGADPQQQRLKSLFLTENTILLPPTRALNAVISARLIRFQFNKDISYFII